MDDGASGQGGRERLLSVALELFLEAGYDGVSMQQIADAVGMTKGAPYHHFSSKEDLFGQALARHIDRTQRELRARMEGRSDLRERMTEGFLYLVEHSDAGLVRLVEDLRRVVGAERMASYGVTIDQLRECNRWLFAQAASSGVPLACRPEDAADLFLAVQVGELSLMAAETRVVSSEVVQQRARRIVDMLLFGLLKDDPGSRPARTASAAALTNDRAGNC
jgi:AcrR family transcriptional regulator